jgi:tetratricopeptide (TPR) repeat protein
MFRMLFFVSSLLVSLLMMCPGALSLADELDGARRACPPCEEDGSEISGLLQKADALYESFQPEEALKELFKVLQMEPDHHGALSRASRAYIDIGDMVPESTPDWQKKRLKQYSIAEQYARQAIEADPDSTWGYFYVAASLGKTALLSPISKQLDLSREIRRQVEKAITLDPQNGFAYHVYGIWQRKMAEIGRMKRLFAAVLYRDSVPKGTLQKSEEYFKKAVLLNPTVIVSHWELARTYVAMQKWQLARQSLETVLELPIQFSDDHLHKKNAERLLQEIKDRP